MAARLQIAQLVRLYFTAQSTTFSASAVVTHCAESEFVIKPSSTSDVWHSIFAGQHVHLSVCDSTGLHQTEAVVTRALASPEGAIGVRPLRDFHTTQNRNFFRVYTRLAASYKVTKSELAEAVNQGDGEAFTQDISAGGVRLWTVRPLRTGDHIRLQLTYANPDEPQPMSRAKTSPKALRHLALDAEVVRCQRCANAKQECYSVGARFLDLPASEQDRLVGLMFSLQRQTGS